METMRILDSLKWMEGLDTEQGILFCNGEDTYVEILRAYCDDWKESGAYAKELFEKKDWKNYTIAVHGMKSSLYSIGVTGISEMAKQLEFAGKENRIDYIEANHSKLMEAYEAFFTKLLENELLCPPAEAGTEATGNLTDIAFERFDGMVSKMEEAAYAFQPDAMIQLVEELEQYRYKGTALAEILVPVRRKIEMADYISAAELLVKKKRELQEDR